MKIFKTLTLASLFSYVVIYVLMKMGAGDIPKRDCSDLERKTFNAKKLEQCLPVKGTP
jgi:hypothetical protein